MSKRRRIWLSILGMLVLYVIAGVLLVQQWMTSENTGTIHTGAPMLTTPSAPSQNLTIQTGYFSTTLPAGFSLKRQSNTPNSDPQLQLLAATPSTTDEQFTVSYNLLPAAGIISAGDYNLRASQATIYAHFIPNDLPAGATAFRTISGAASLVVFWPHGSHYAELAVSSEGAASLDQLQAVFSQVIRSWRWD